MDKDAMKWRRLHEIHFYLDLVFAGLSFIDSAIGRFSRINRYGRYPGQIHKNEAARSHPTHERWRERASYKDNRAYQSLPRRDSADSSKAAAQDRSEKR
jgi:hypothetical protein